MEKPQEIARGKAAATERLNAYRQAIGEDPQHETDNPQLNRQAFVAFQQPNAPRAGDDLKALHVNMMTDTVIANLPPDGLRTILRGLMGLDPKSTPKFNSLVARYLALNSPDSVPDFFGSEEWPDFEDEKRPDETPAFLEWQRKYRCLMGCGMGFESLSLLGEVVHQVQCLKVLLISKIPGYFRQLLATLDADLVQSVTAVQRNLLTPDGSRKFEIAEANLVNAVLVELRECRRQSQHSGAEFPFARGLSRLQMIDGSPILDESQEQPDVIAHIPAPGLDDKGLECFHIGSSVVPRIFMGLWQFSSPSWGTASKSKINEHFRQHVDAGFIAFDMADHYGDAEVTFGGFRKSQPDAANIFCATKYCIFESISITEDVVKASISERLVSINAASIDLLQLHWQNYDDHQYVKMAQLASQDSRVRHIGLCNFDTHRMDEITNNGIHVATNQVQFSLVDQRPTFKMAISCRKHDIKLLTYGSLCGGFLSNRWKGKPAPNMFDEGMTPSHRKYFEMIAIWGGWQLFQNLLLTLSTIGQRYNVSISNVATRWVLDHDYVGAVIIGGRMGISEHVEENLKVFSFKLDDDDKSAIRKILDNSRAKDVFETMGDCGAEYRH